MVETREIVTMGAPVLEPEVPPVNAANVSVFDLDNDSLILRLQMTINHLSRWLTPIHDQRVLALRRYREEPSVLEYLQTMRDEELFRFPQMQAIATYNNPNLDLLPDPFQVREQRGNGHPDSPLSVLSEFRRLRQSTTALLRSLPNDAWERVGTSRNEHDWQIRDLAAYLANHDTSYMYSIDDALNRLGIRDELASYARVSYPELLQLVPVRIKG